MTASEQRTNGNREKELLESVRKHLESAQRNREKREYHRMRTELLLAPLLKKYGLR